VATFYDRGRLAQSEHDRKLRTYLKENLDALVQRQKLVKNGKVKTDISILELPTLKYGDPDKEQLGRGGGGGGKDGKKDQQQKAQSAQDGDGTEKVDVTGRQGADEHGDTQTVDLDFDEFVRLAQEQLIEELDLPQLNPPRLEGDMLSQDEVAQMEIDRPGLPSDIHLEETMFESLKRNIRDKGKLDYDVDTRLDAWYYVDTPQDERTNRALEVYLLDISGSVSGHNIALIRKFIFILWYYLDRKYTHNERRFIVFQDDAEQVTREDFFAIESRGGTHISAGFSSALDTLDGFGQYDKFLFFFSDGDNSSSDDDEAKKRLDDVLSQFDLLCYGRINPCDSPISPFNRLIKQKLADVNNMTFTDIRDLDNVKTTLEAFLKLLHGEPKSRRP